MAFVSTNISRVDVVALTARDSDDGALTDKTGCFTDGDTEKNCEELTAGSEGLRVQFNIPISVVISITMKFWDQGAMDTGDWACMPYTDANSVSTTNEIVEALVDDADTDFVLDSAFMDDLGDADGSGNFAVRFAIAAASIAKPKASEVQYEIVYDTTAVNGFTFDVDGDPLGSIVVQAFRVTTASPLELECEPFDMDTSNAVTGAYTLNLFASDWVLIAFDAGTPDKMDISERITVG
jgi:hypothetical protein